MQGPPPTSPGFSSPPGKKLRAGNSPQDRRAELLRLSRSPGSQIPSAGSLMDRARSSLAGPPVLPVGSLRPTAISQTSLQQRNGTRPAGSGPPSFAPPINATFFPPTQTKKEMSKESQEQQPTVLGDANNQANHPHQIPPAAAFPAQPRKSDLFPNVGKAGGRAPPSPKTPQPVATPNITAAALKNNDPSPDDLIARRLEQQFTPNKEAESRSKSAPPSRPPPPPRPQAPAPPPSKPSGGGKSVSFSSPVAAKEIPPEETPRAPPMNGTPFPTKSMPDAGHTPFHAPPVTESPEVDRLAFLQQMRAVADTPANNKKQESPELRLQKELASAYKAKAESQRKVAQLEDQIHDRNKKEHKTVGFLSPILGNPAGRIMRKTPHPKRRVQNGSIPSEREQECLTVAAKSVPFEYEYEPEDGEQPFTCKIRRPFGLDANERDLWFRHGHVNSKLYRQSAAVAYESTLEIATSPLPDGSVLSLHGQEELVLHLKDGTSQADPPLNNVQYIDDEGNDKEYSLVVVLETLVDARRAYCAAVRSAADALLLQPTPTTAPPPPATPPATNNITTDATAPPTTAPPKETVDKGIETDPIDFGHPPPQPSVEDEMPDDVLGNSIYWFVSFLVGIVVWLVKLPFRIVGTTLYFSVVAVLLAIVWVQLKDYLGGDAGNAIVFHKNSGGIM